ncbi:DHS-like NAD/FAD-binding domain-containing protein [Xylariaceae sp. FL1651]|nr:DHS-like NAD/FAD-binding domain-containing protein [Xylariaceae sp. FL1651]
MPTIQITPDAAELLQNVADTLAKARKMVIITGAGISTNSGIPDFRSENGLYSLIQDQFERAEAHAKKDTLEDEATSTAFDISDRPTKRRRLSGSDRDKLPAASLADASLSSKISESQDQATPVLKDFSAGVEYGMSSNQENSTQDQVIVGAPLDSSRRLTRSQATASQPPLSRYSTQRSIDSSISRDSLFTTESPSCESSQTDHSIIVGGPDNTDSSTGTDTPKITTGDLTSSSPLSSPPPILFDPYENTNSSTDSSSRDNSDCSYTSDSDDTQQSLDLFSSQASSANLRNMKGRDLFDCNIWADPLKTSVFYRFATSLRQRVKEVEPTVTHRFIAQMRDVGKLARVYTQNIDEIEKKIGLSTDLKYGVGNRRRKSTKQQPSEPEDENTESPRHGGALGNTEATHGSKRTVDATQHKPRLNVTPDKGVECVFLHGSLHALRCFVCGKLCDWDEEGRETCTLSGEQPECPHCAGATAARQEKGKRALGIGKLRPDIVLYGEEHPQSDLISPIVQHDLAAGPDLLLVLGTSLRVHGLKVMVKEFAKAVHKKGGKVIFINFTKPSESAWGDVLDYWIDWDCDAWVEDLRIRKPHLWLSPNELLELDRQKRETLAEKRKETLKKRESTSEKKVNSIGDKGQRLPHESKPRPPPKNPSSMRNDYQCGAYVIWDIFQTLARIGDRPFDNLGYIPLSSKLESASVPNSSPGSNTGRHCEPGVSPQVNIKIQKRKRKSVPGRALSHATSAPLSTQSSTCQLGLHDAGLPSNKPSSTGRLSPSTPALPISLVDSETTRQSITTTHTTRLPAKAKTSRKPTPTTHDPIVKSERKTKSVIKGQNHEKCAGRDQYLKAVKELARSRKTPSPGYAGIPNQAPATPRNLPLTFKLYPPHLHPALKLSRFEGQASPDEGDERYRTSSYPSQPRPILPPLGPHTFRHGTSTHSLPVPVTKRELLYEGPVLAPLNWNWKQSPPSKIEPMEPAPLVEPLSPLTDIRPNSSQPHYSYTLHHPTTQPIHSDSREKASRQGIAQGSQKHVKHKDDNTPSPSDQLRLEAAYQLSQMHGRK